MTSRPPRAVAAFLPLVLPGLAGCGQVHEDAVRTTAAEFYAAYESRDGEAACADLAPKTRNELAKSAGKPCDKAVLEEDVPAVGEPVRVRVFGTQALVEYPSESIFLAEFDTGWKVMAAGCNPRPGKPYDCVISGG